MPLIYAGSTFLRTVSLFNSGIDPGQSLSFDFIFESGFIRSNRVIWTSAASVSHIGEFLSHTAKSQSKATYEWVLDTLREKDYSCNMDDSFLKRRGQSKRQP